MTTGTLRRVKLLTNRHNQQTNTQFFCRPDALPVAQHHLIMHVFIYLLVLTCMSSARHYSMQHDRQAIAWLL